MAMQQVAPRADESTVVGQAVVGQAVVGQAVVGQAVVGEAGVGESGADVAYVFCLMQVAFLLLGGLGEQLLMGGNPLYLAMPLAKVVLLLVLAAKVVKGRRWALITLIIVQAVTLVGFQLQWLGGLLPMVDFTVNLVVLLTNALLPLAVIGLCVKELTRERR